MEFVSAKGQYDHLNSEIDPAVLKVMASGHFTLIYYPTEQHRVLVFSGCPGSRGEFPNAHKYMSSALCLPFSPYLGEDEQLRVIEVLRSC